jgi:alanine dehydrogenase
VLATPNTNTQDDDYKAAGAKIVDRAAAFQADIVLKVKPPSLKEADMLKERARWVWV